MKKCGCCSVFKDLSCFNLDNQTVSGYSCYCKACVKEKSTEAYKKRAEDHEWKLSQTLRASKNRAKTKNIEHTLTLDELKALYPKDGKCPVYGFDLEWGEPKWSSPSLDRINSTKGYTFENCQIISNRANKLKSDATLEELELLVDYLKENGFD